MYGLGSNYGMGKTRSKELYEACKILGIEENNILIQKHSLLPDSMTAKWPVDVISSIVHYNVEAYNIDTVITFDKHGISRHANHCSIYYAIANLSLEKKLPKSK